MFLKKTIFLTSSLTTTLPLNIERWRPVSGLGACNITLGHLTSGKLVCSTTAIRERYVEDCYADDTINSARNCLLCTNRSCPPGCLGSYRIWWLSKVAKINQGSVKTKIRINENIITIFSSNALQNLGLTRSLFPYERQIPKKITTSIEKRMGEKIYFECSIYSNNLWPQLVSKGKPGSTRSGFSLDFLAQAQPEEQFMGQFTRHHMDVNIPIGLNLR